MYRKARKAVLVASAVLMASAIARAQPVDPAADPIDALLGAAPATSTPDAGPIRLVRSSSHPLSAADSQAFRQAIEAARRGDAVGARMSIGQIGDSLARKTATWALSNAAPDRMGFSDLDQARRDLLAWPRSAGRQVAAEKLLETSGKSPGQVVEWFAGAEPQTAEGAMALASAYRSLGRDRESADLIRRWWREKSFEAEPQRRMLTRFGDVLGPDDHARRADLLLYGPHGPAMRDMVALLPADRQGAALARIALRADAGGALDQAQSLPMGDAQSAGVAFERGSYLRRKGLDTLAQAQVAYYPREVFTTEQASRIWSERYRLVLSALRSGDSRAAYAAAANSGLTQGGDAADAEFYAGWLALTRLKDPQAAARHFAALERIGSSPITRGRALYWQGRAAEVRGDRQAANDFYARAAAYPTVFYGQLAAEKLGRPLVLPPDPVVTPADRVRFEGLETVQAARLLFDQDQRDLFRVMVLHLDDVLPTTLEIAQLVDLVRGYGDQDTSMKVVRGAAQRGLILTQRGYPVRTPPTVDSAPEMSLVMGITRQESGFDPLVRSGVGARGMMQLMPATAQLTARRIGVSYAPSMLDEPDYNMRLGSTYLGQLIGQFSGSYVMAIAGYNAGPGRPIQWSSFCGDPRGGATDPIDFIECIPFSETRNYVMRVMEGMQVYRAKMNGGSAPVTLAADLRRGAYGSSLPGASASSQ